MKNATLFTALVLLWSLATGALAQDDTVWVRWYDGTGGVHDYATDIALDNNGAVIVVGKTWSDQGSYDFVTLKYTPEGELLWSATYDGPAKGDDSAMAVAVTRSGDIFVCGISEGTNATDDFLLIKYSESGDTAWTRRYDAGQGDRAKEVATDVFGNAVVTGGSRASNGYDFLTIMYSPEGNVVWSKRYNGYGSLNDSANALHVDREGFVYVTGSSYRRANFSNHPSICTVKYGPDGVAQWAAHRWEYDPCSGTDVVSDNAGNVYITGYEGSFSGYQKQNFVTIKYNASGAAQWIKLYNGAASSYDYGRRITVDNSGNVFVTGESYASGSGYDYMTLKYGPTGIMLASHRFDGPISGNDYPSDMWLLGADSLLVTGASPGDGTSLDIATILYDSELNIMLSWPRRFNGAADMADRAAAVIADSGGIYVAGSSDADLTFFDLATIKYETAQPVPFCDDFRGLFCDDFADQASTVWQSPTGSYPGSCDWLVADGAYGTSAAGTEQLCLRSVLNAEWRNYVFSVDVKGEVGLNKEVAFRSQDGMNTYDLDLVGDPVNEIHLNKVVAGISNRLQTVSFPNQNGLWYSLKIACVDEKITVTVDDQQVLEYIDINQPYYRGGIGLVMWTGDEAFSQVSFDNVSVTDPFPYIEIDDPGRDFYVGELVTLTGMITYQDGSPYVPISGYIGVEDPISAMTRIVPVADDGSFSYSTNRGAEAAGMWMLVFVAACDYGEVHQAFNVPVTRMQRSGDQLYSSRSIEVATGHVQRPLEKRVDAFSGRNPLEGFKAAAATVGDAARTMWNTLKADVVTSWQRTTAAGVNRQMLQNAEHFNESCNPLNPITYGNCANLTASYAYLTAVTVLDAGWVKAGEAGDILLDAGLIDECQNSQWQATLDVSDAIVSFAGKDWGKTIDVATAFAEGADLGLVQESIENSLSTCLLQASAAENPYPFAAATFETDFADVVLVGLIPKIPKALVINGYSPIELTVLDPLGRYIDKDGTDIPGAQYLQVDTDMDGENEQIVIVPLEQVGDVQVYIQQAPEASPSDTFSVIANYTYYQNPVVIADSLQIVEIPVEPLAVVTFDNLPPNPVILITADDTTFASFPCLLQWHSTSDPNPDHVVSYDLILSTDSIFLESFAVPLAQDTSYSFDFQTTSRRPAPTGSVDYYWKVQARDDWNAASSSPTGVFRVSSCCTGIRGNANFDIEDKVNIADIAYLVDWLFGIPGGPQPSCREEGNANGDSEEKMSISDVTYLIRYLFGMPPGPVPPSCP